jgi:hypothetical protein
MGHKGRLLSTFCHSVFFETFSLPPVERIGNTIPAALFVVPHACGGGCNRQRPQFVIKAYEKFASLAALGIARPDEETTAPRFHAIELRVDARRISFINR